MAAPTRKLAGELARIAAACPVDPLRPHIQLQNFLKSLSTHPRLTPAAVRAAQALERNEIQKKYALTDKIMNPASAPRHYERLAEGIQKSMQGIGRPRWKAEPGNSLVSHRCREVFSSGPSLLLRVKQTTIWHSLYV
ncbi:hypothetical protein B0H10DRAFT_2027428 [Mycena sp. CBHHK59/15]|nr:hypothetical protein B0H10DRAFT_2027428 [Mycena sp. CBHHK59/15]